MLQRILSLVLVSALLGCGYLRKEPEPTVSPVDTLGQVYRIYSSLSGEHGPVLGCDALLYNSLTAVARNEPIAIESYRDSLGAWHRLPGPDYSASCSSSISRDMLLGLLTYIWHFQRLDLAVQLWNYGKDHAWIMGVERKFGDTRTLMSPQMIGLLATVIYALGGADHPERHIPQIYTSEPGFVSHLSMLSIRLNAEIYGGVDPYQLATIRDILRHMTQNPLAQALYHKYQNGDQTVATALLLSTWPALRLPTNEDWCAVWRTQRSDGDESFLPCSEPRLHNGGDFLFAAALVLELL